jgi:hypothetical protein
LTRWGCTWPIWGARWWRGRNGLTAAVTAIQVDGHANREAAMLQDQQERLSRCLTGGALKTYDIEDFIAAAPS